MATYINKLASEGNSDSQPDAEHIAATLRDEDVETRIGWLCVDSNWQIIGGDLSSASSGAIWKPGEKIVLSAIHDSALVDRSAPHGNRRSVDALLQTDQGRSPAVAYSLAEGSGYVVFYTRANAIVPDPVVVVQSLPAAGVITFLLMAGLQGLVSYLAFMRLQDVSNAKQQNWSSDEESLRRTQALIRTRDTIIFGLAKLAESRDTDTGQHLERISLYSTLLATALRRVSKFRDDITPAFVRLIGISSALHDIGKVGIEDAILLKPGPLTVEERQRIQQHAQIGSECLASMERRLGTSNFLQMANQIALYHHERWNGMGYPHGLSGEAIPLAARIVAIADVYDALSIRRTYKEPWPHEQCVDKIREQAGQHFDPDMVEVFLEVDEQFREIAAQYADRSAAPVVHQEREADSVMLKADAERSTPLDAVIAAVQPVPATQVLEEVS